MLSYFISKNIRNNKGFNFSRLSHKIGVVIISVGLATMIVFSLTLEGMQKAIKNKVYGLNGHIRIKKFSLSDDIEEYPIFSRDLFNLKSGKNNVNIKMLPIISKLGLVKYNKDIEGIRFKGYDISKLSNFQHIDKYIIEGRNFRVNETGSIIISKKISKKLKLKLGKSVIALFVQDPPRLKKLIVVGIFNTNIPDIDERLALCNQKMIQGVNVWSKDMIGCYEVHLKSTKNIEKVFNNLASKLRNGLRVQTITNQYRSLFDWLKILEKNKLILFIIILIVACTNISCIVVIQLIERTYMIGLLKVLGAQNNLLRNIFFWNGFDIIVKGLFFGNLIGLGICVMQYFFKIIKLDPDGIYIEYAHIDWDIISCIFINTFTISIVSIITYFLLFIILKFKPIKMITFD